MSARRFRDVRHWPWCALFSLATSGCLTEPDGVASVSVSPSQLQFTSIHDPAQTLTVTVTGNDGKQHTDIPVTFTYWVGVGAPLSPWSSVIDIQRDGETSYRVTPRGVPGAAFFYANAGGKSSMVALAGVRSGPPVALAFEVPRRFRIR